MNDRELLELAATAFGLVLSDEHGGHGGTWNPLTDDGDALRLAVKLQLLVNVDATASQAGDGKKVGECEIHRFSDPYAATRRAIVRAAAAIGKEMQP